MGWLGAAQLPAACNLHTARGKQLQVQALAPSQPQCLLKQISPSRTNLNGPVGSTSGLTDLSGWQIRSAARCNLLSRPQAVSADQLAFWDVVEYEQQLASPSAAVRLGLIQQVEPGIVKLSPLIEEDEGVWVPESEDAESSEQQEQVPLDRVLRIVETAYGQRQDKEHNPHGEHAHDVWQVLVPLSPAVFTGRDRSKSS